MQTATVRPVIALEGELAPHLSRWLWLVKWLLAIPHFVVLVFLWIAFAVLTVIAFFAVLFTGRYPRGISASTSACCAGRGASNFYTFGALGTDRTRHSRSRTCPTTRRGSRSTTRRTCAAACPDRLVAARHPAVLHRGHPRRRPDRALGLIGILVLVAGVLVLFRNGTRRTSSTSCSASTAGCCVSSPTRRS